MSHIEEITRLVNQLTLPEQVHRWQEDESGGMRLRTIYVPSLLDQLNTAIASGSGTGAGGVGEKRAANVLDPDALTLYDDVRRGAAHLLYTETGRREPRAEPAELLRRWLRLYARRIAGGQDTMAHAGGGESIIPVGGKYTIQSAGEILYRSAGDILYIWANRIEAKFDPPRAIEILLPCPACDARHTEGETRASALVAFLRPGSVNVQCRVCQEVWHGEEQMKNLRRRATSE
jgi:hypothetical protein